MPKPAVVIAVARAVAAVAVLLTVIIERLLSG
jgi:hypothetical protein